MEITVTLQDAHVALIAGGISLAIAVVLMLYYHRSKMLLDEMWAVDTYESRELRRMCSDGFNAIVEVTGSVTCDNPVTSPASKLPCCWCRTIVEREVERVHHDKNGSHTERSWEKQLDRTITSIFKVHDATGYTLVDPTHADIDTEDPYMCITTQREPWFGTAQFSDTGNYRIREEFFLPTGNVYVLGQASSCGEGPAADVLVHYPSHGYQDPGHRFFIISRKSEKELVKTNEISLKVCFWAGVLGFFFAAYCGLHYLGVLP